MRRLRLPGDAVLGERCEWDRRDGTILPIFHFCLAGFERSLADDYTIRDTEEIALGELLPRPEIAVIVQYLDARPDQLVIDLFRFLILSEGNQMDLERRHRFRPHHALLI